MDKKNYKLCYVDGNLMYFTDNFKNQWGDDWDDAPYEHNADPPYRISEKYPDSETKNSGHIIMAAWYDEDYDTKLPYENYGNSPYSVQDINAGAIAWLYKRNCGGLMGGATLEEAQEFCAKHNIMFAILEVPTIQKKKPTKKATEEKSKESLKKRKMARFHAQFDK